MAAGGWATVNEFRYLDRHPDVVAGANFFVWEYMAHQMGGLASWSRSTLHPLERPLWLTGYVVGKALDQRFPTAARFEVNAPSDEQPSFAEFEALLAGRNPGDVINSCGSGVSACHNILAMTHAGLTGAALYGGSWSEWVADPGRPVATGPQA
jgi:hypothetical protein